MIVCNLLPPFFHFTFKVLCSKYSDGRFEDVDDGPGNLVRDRCSGTVPVIKLAHWKYSLVAQVVRALH